MKYNFIDYFEITIMNILLISVSIIVCIVFKFNYDLGVVFCNVNNISVDLSFSMMGAGVAVEIAIVLFVAEFLAIFCLAKLLRKIPFINSLINYLIV